MSGARLLITKSELADHCYGEHVCSVRLSAKTQDRPLPAGPNDHQSHAVA